MMQLIVGVLQVRGEREVPARPGVVVVVRTATTRESGARIHL